MDDNIPGLVTTRQCCCCGAPLQAVHIVTKTRYASPYIEWRGVSYCAHCAPLVGFSLENRYHVANRSIFLSFS